MRSAGSRVPRAIVSMISRCSILRERNFVGEMTRPSSSRTTESAGIEPGAEPPTSAWWALLTAYPRREPRWKIGFTRVMAGRWDPPRYGSFTITWSPSARPPPISSRRTSIVTGIDPRWTGMCSACATMRPSASNKAQLASIRSLMFGEYAVLRSAIPISSGTNETAFRRISSSAGFVLPHPDLDHAVAHDPEPSLGRDESRGLVLLDDRGPLGVEPERESVPAPDPRVRPSVVEQGAAGGRWRRSSCVDPRKRFRAGHEGGESDRDDLERFGAGRVPVSPAMFSSEGSFHHRRERHVDRVALAYEPEVHAGKEFRGPRCEALGGEAANRLSLQSSETLLHRRAGPAQRPDQALGVIEAHVRGQNPIRRERTRKERDEDMGRADLPGEERSMERTGPAEREEGQVSRVQAPPREDRLHRPHHVRLDHPPHAQNRLILPEMHRVPEGTEALL